MSDAGVHLSLVIPVRNGAPRLATTLCDVWEYLSHHSGAAELILVDDCSEAPTARLLEEFCRGRSGVTLLRNGENRGKGFSVARGLLAARGAYRVFTDADLAYPPTEIDRVIRELERGSDVAIACRVLPESRYELAPTFIPYLYTRHLMSRVFNAIVRHTLLPGVLDSQAGLKGFTARAAELIFRRLTIPGFAFDVECLYVARKHRLRVTQTPVYFRYDSEPSTVHFLRDAVRMVRDVAKVHLNDWRGRYA
jgi:dolichyl-phosphate beta-glucosyltransferase